MGWFPGQAKAPAPPDVLERLIESGRLPKPGEGPVHARAVHQPQPRDLKKNRNTPIIINSRSTTVLKILQSHLIRRFATIQLFSYHGGLSTSKRIDVLNQWEACPNGILLLSTKSGSTGMTLTHAHVMISIDALSDPNWSILDQVEARIYRIGQKHKVTLYRLAIIGTVDEVIGGEIHNFKKEASQQILSNSENQKKVSSVNIPSIYYKATQKWANYIKKLKETHDVRAPVEDVIKVKNIENKRRPHQVQKYHPYKRIQQQNATPLSRKPQFAEKDGKIVIIN